MLYQAMTGHNLTISDASLIQIAPARLRKSIAEFVRDRSHAGSFIGLSLTNLVQSAIRNLPTSKRSISEDIWRALESKRRAWRGVR
jgi:hypothetical protein